MYRPPPRSTRPYPLLPYTSLIRSQWRGAQCRADRRIARAAAPEKGGVNSFLLFRHPVLDPGSMNTVLDQFLIDLCSWIPNQVRDDKELADCPTSPVPAILRQGGSYTFRAGCFLLQKRV